MNIYYTTPGSYNISVVVHDLGTGNYWNETKTLVVVAPPSMNVYADAGSTYPTDLVGIGNATGGAMPYKSSTITVASQTFNGIINPNFATANGTVYINQAGTYTVTYTIVDANGVEWSASTTVTVSAPSTTSMYPIIVSASMQVYFNNNLVYAGPAVWNSSGTLNATFLMPNEQYASSQVYSVNVSYSLLLYIIIQAILQQ